jgi:hypothetical protein
MFCVGNKLQVPKRDTFYLVGIQPILKTVYSVIHLG